GDLAERALLAPSDHALARRVGLVADALAAAEDGDRPAPLGPDADSQQRDAFAAEGVGGVFEAALVVLAVGDDDDGAGARRAGGAVLVGEGPAGGEERVGEVGALRGDEAGVGGVEEEAEGRVVAREGALEEGVAGEDDEAEAVAAPGLGHPGDGEAGALEPARRHVLGEHRDGDVEGEDEVEALLLRLAEGGPVAWP